MNIPAGINKWGVAVLGAVSALLVINLVAQYRNMQPGKGQHAPVSASPVRVGKVSSHAADDLAKYNPEVHFDALKALDARPFPDDDSDPFGPLEAPAPPQAMARGPAPSAPSLPPAPPPPPPLKAMGYNELPGGQKEAMITFKEDMLTVHEGDLIGTQYKVLTIDPSKVVVEDGETHTSLDLPFPQ